MAGWKLIETDESWDATRFFPPSLGFSSEDILPLRLAEYMAQSACCSRSRTTKLYDRRQDEISLDEVERIAI